jgi:hypothetical protein
MSDNQKFCFWIWSAFTKKSRRREISRWRKMRPRKCSLLMYPGLSPAQQNRVVEGIARFGKADESSMPLPTSSKSLTGSTSNDMLTAPQ